MKWPWTTLGDICTSAALGPFGSALRADEYTPAGVPVLRGQNVSSCGALDLSDLVFVSAATAGRFPAAAVEPGDVVAPHRGAIGRFGRVPEGFGGMVSSSMIRATISSEMADSRFITAYFNSSVGRDEILMHASTVGTPGIAQPLTSFKSFRVPLPPMDEQRAIAEVLGALDDKIAANDQLVDSWALWRAARVRLLEHASDALSALSDLAEFVGRGRAPRYSEDITDPWVINQKCVRAGSVELAAARRTSGNIDAARMLRFGDVLVNSTGMGTLGRVGIWTVPAIATCDSHVSIVRFGEQTPLCRAQQLLNRETALEALGEGSTGQTEMSRALLSAFTLPSLSDDAIDAERELRSAHDQERHLKAESQTLAALRDTLLPGLMDGSIRVKDAEASVSEVL